MELILHTKAVSAARDDGDLAVKSATTNKRYD